MFFAVEVVCQTPAAEKKWEPKMITLQVPATQLWAKSVEIPAGAKLEPSSVHAEWDLNGNQSGKSDIKITIEEGAVVARGKVTVGQKPFGPVTRGTIHIRASIRKPRPATEPLSSKLIYCPAPISNLPVFQDVSAQPTHVDLKFYRGIVFKREIDYLIEDPEAPAEDWMPSQNNHFRVQIKNGVMTVENTNP